MSAFPKYPSYKPSGVEWLGDVPEHWEVEKGLRYFFETEARSATGDEELLSVSHLTGVTPRSEKNITMFMAESYEGSKLCEVGDIAVNTMWAWMSALGVSRYRGLVSPSYSTYRQKKPERFHPTFLDHLLRTEVYRSHYTVNSTGITTSRLRLYPHSFLRLKFPCPPRAEQDRIVAFLDEKTAEIDRLIAKKQRQIELLDEQKAILINRAVTRGLHPQAELQDSGIPWIGPIPKDWNTKRVKHVCRNIATGGTPRDVRHREDCSDGLTWYTPGDFKVDGVLQGSERVALPKRGENVEVYPPHSIYFIGIGGTIGTINRSLVAGSCNQQINVLAIDDSANSAAYFAFLLQSAKMFVVNTSDYTTLPIINRSKTASIAVVQPPRREQVEIAAHCEMISIQTSKAKALIESQIQTLQTLRSTLIAHAVTGKIKVS